MKQENFVTPEIAMELKKIGFNNPSFALFILGDIYTKDGSYFREQPDSRHQCLAPLRQEAFKWFRDELQIDGYVCKTYDNRGFYWSNRHESTKYETYEKAEDGLLRYFISLVKNRI